MTIIIFLSNELVDVGSFFLIHSFFTEGNFIQLHHPLVQCLGPTQALFFFFYSADLAQLSISIPYVLSWHVAEPERVAESSLLT